MDPLSIYLIVAVVAGLFTLALLWLGADHDFDFGHGHDISDGSHHGPGPFSPLFIAAFLGGIGIIGASLEYLTALHSFLTLVISIVGAIPVHLAMWLGFSRYVGRTEGQVTTHGVVGLSGVVEVTIRPGQHGSVAINTPTGIMSYPARASDDSTLPYGVGVKVVEQHGHIVVVE